MIRFLQVSPMLQGLFEDMATLCENLDFPLEYLDLLLVLLPQGPLCLSITGTFAIQLLLSIRYYDVESITILSLLL